MFIIDKIKIKLGRARAISYIGGIILTIGAILSFTSEYHAFAYMIVFSGLFISILGTFYGYYFVTCPRCGHNIGKDAFINSNIGFELNKKYTICPYCKLSLKVEEQQI
jgi:hypothetical protein